MSWDYRCMPPFPASSFREGTILYKYMGLCMVILNHYFKFFVTFICVYVQTCIFVCVHTYYRICVVVRGQLVGIGSLLLCRSEGPDSGCHVWQQAPLPADLGFNAFWFETGSLQYIAQGGLKLCLPSGITGMRYHARPLTGFCIA